MTKRRVGTKALVFSPGAVAWDFMLPGTRFDFQKEVGDGLRSSVITGPLNWIMRAFPEAPVVVERQDGEQWKVISNHPLATLLRSPNPYYGGRTLWMATVMDFCFGEAYWLKVRNGKGELTELWWIPRALISPKWDDYKKPDVFITHYEYRVGGRLHELATDDVVHFRFGMDPANIRRGFSQLAAVFREVYVDDQASNFTASILRNLGIIGLVFSPEAGGTPIPKGALDEFKKYIQQNFTGDKRGQALAFGAPTKAQVLSYNLSGFDVGPIRDVSEERVCAALGIPAAVVGFGTGLQQTKVGATMRELIQLAWKGAIMPTQEIISDEMDRALLHEFQSNLNLFRVQFDTSKVRALWEDVAGKHERIRADAQAGLIRLDEARRELGYEVLPEHEVWLVPTNVQVVSDDRTELLMPSAAQPAAPGAAPGAAAPGAGNVKTTTEVNNATTATD